MTLTNTDGSQIDQEIFFDERDEEPYKFGVRQTDDVKLAGSYPFNLTLTMKKYPENKVYLTEPHIINIVDPCDAPTYIAPPEDLDGTVIRYTLTEPALTFSFDQFY